MLLKCKDAVASIAVRWTRSQTIGDYCRESYEKIEPQSLFSDKSALHARADARS